MKIHYLNKSKKPKIGDLKVMKDGTKFIRHFKIIDGMRCVSNSRPLYEWVSFGDNRVTSYRRNIERNYPEWLS